MQFDQLRRRELIALLGGAATRAHHSPLHSEFSACGSQRKRNGDGGSCRGQAGCRPERGRATPSPSTEGTG
jgi:hypothetical protein